MLCCVYVMLLLSCSQQANSFEYIGCEISYENKK
jgi:hypothetical protein